MGWRSCPAPLTLIINSFQRRWSSFSTDNLSSSLILFVYCILKLPVVVVIFAVVVFVTFVSVFLVVTIPTDIATAAMIKTLTMLINVIRNNFFFLVTSTLKRKSISLLHFEYKKQHTLLFSKTSLVLHLYLSPSIETD